MKNYDTTVLQTFIQSLIPLCSNLVFHILHYRRKRQLLNPLKSGLWELADINKYFHMILLCCYLVFMTCNKSEYMLKGKHSCWILAYITFNVRSYRKEEVQKNSFMYIQCLKYKVAFNLKQTCTSNKGICWQFFRGAMHSWVHVIST